MEVTVDNEVRTKPLYLVSLYHISAISSSRVDISAHLKFGEAGQLTSMNSTQVFGPGDHLLTLPSTGKVKVGSGITVQDKKLVSLKCGVARQTSSGKIWIEGRQRRYFPTEGDQVVGIILERFGESWTVDIRGPFTANLPSLAFENVTRRNRPNLVPGDVIYARVVSAPRDADPEIACTDASGRVRSKTSRLLTDSIVALDVQGTADHPLSDPLCERGSSQDEQIYQTCIAKLRSADVQKQSLA